MEWQNIQFSNPCFSNYIILHQNDCIYLYASVCLPSRLITSLSLDDRWSENVNIPTQIKIITFYNTFFSNVDVFGNRYLDLVHWIPYSLRLISIMIDAIDGVRGRYHQIKLILELCIFNNSCRTEMKLSNVYQPFRMKETDKINISVI